MAKLVAGVKSFKSVAAVTVPVTVTRYRISNGRTFDDAATANAAQTRLNVRAKSAAIREFLKSSGVTFPSTSSSISAEKLAAALLNPKFAAKLYMLAG